VSATTVQAARVEIHESVDISASANEVWELISDWAGMLRWWLSADDGGLQGPILIACSLVGQPENVPRKRRMELDNGAIVEEEIFYQNNETRRLHYIETDDQEIKGYVASTYVDELSSTTCTVHVSSSFDALSPLSPASAAARFKAIYTAMFNGYRRYFAGNVPID
jgi:hypothetical protein